MPRLRQVPLRTARHGVAGGFVAAALVLMTLIIAARPAGDLWSREERAAIRSLSLTAAGPIPADPSNRFANDRRAAALGKAFFFDAALSRNGIISCGACHQPGLSWQDGTPLGQGVGTTGRRTQPIAGTAYSPWLFWDGRADSQWSQALGPLESPVEHGGTRTLYARVIAANYRARYEAVFGAAPSLLHLPASAGPNGNPSEKRAWESMPFAVRDSVTQVFVNIGKAIAAFERTIVFAPSRFDRYAERITSEDESKPIAGTDPSATLSASEVAGLRLFLGKGRCVQCHTGPMFTDNKFHNIGVGGVVDGKPDMGRNAGMELFRSDEFNCRGLYSDAKPSECALILSSAARDSNDIQAFRTPSLRNVARRAPYGHTGQFATLAAILDHHNRAPLATVGRNELTPLGLSATELGLIEAFLQTLDSRVVFALP